MKNNRNIMAAALASAAALMMPAMHNLTPPPMPAHSFQRYRNGKRKGNFPQGKKMRITPPYPNPRGNYVKNPKQAAQMNAMHDAWYEKKFGKKPQEGAQK